MKSLHKIILLALLPLMGACGSMLDIEPHSAVSPTVVGSDDIEALRIGMYNKVQEGPTYYSYIAFDLFGGELMTSTGRPIDLINSLSNALHTFVSSQWNGYYKALLQVNNVMSIAEGLADSPTRNRVLGECHYFRAHIYLCLVTRFGDVPVLRQNTQAKVSRDPASMAWALVEEDLDAASGFLNGLSADSFYYVSPAAVTALKARVKLYLGKKGEAKELAESLITNPNYALDDFDKIFRSKANKEVIFAFSCLTEDGSSIKISNQFYSYNHPNKGSYNYRPAGDVMTMYADEDLRKEVSITTLDNLNFINKYPSGQTGSDPVVISRLAEMSGKRGFGPADRRRGGRRRHSPGAGRHHRRLRVAGCRHHRTERRMALSGFPHRRNQCPFEESLTPGISPTTLNGCIQRMHPFLLHKNSRIFRYGSR